MKSNNNFYNVGLLVNTQGIRGEVRVLSRTDFPEERFKPGAVVYLFLEGKFDGLPLEIESYRTHKNFTLLKFKDHSNINDVEKYKGATLRIPEDDLQDLPEGEYYVHEIIGCDVETDEGEQLGEIVDVLKPGANDVWVIKDPKTKKDLLIPVIDDVVKTVDIDAKKITVHLLEGLR